MIAALLVVLAAAQAPAQQIDLESEALSFAPDARTAIAVGSVVARSGALVVTCGRAEATYGADRRIERLHLLESVRLVRKSDGLVADGGEATWDVARSQLVLQQEPQLRRGRDVIRGERMTVWLDADRIEVEGPRVGLAARNRGGGDSRDPVEIRAARLVVTEQRSKAVFDGAVRIRQGASVQATAARAEARTAKAATDAEPDLSQVVLTGDVKLRHGDKEGTCRQAHLDAQTGDVTMEGSPSVQGGDYAIEGDVIVVNGSTGHARVERARARIRGHR